LHTESLRASFEETVAEPGDGFALDRAALLIAAEEYPDLPIDCYVVELDVLARRIRERLHADAGPHEVLRRMRQVLVVEEGFSGNCDQYYDPRNSFLNDVLDRRVGIPIALSTVYLEIARRIGFPLEGVGFPGHFLVKYSHHGDDIVVDPFHDGSILTTDDLERRLDEMFGGRIRHEAKLLTPVSSRRLLFRMLGNLKSIYLRNEDSRRALAAVERMLILEPSEVGEHRDRGLLLKQLGRPIEALQSLSRYRALAPEATDHTTIGAMVEELKLRVGMAN